MNEAYFQAFGKTVQNQREAQGLSISKFALMVGISRPTIYKIERGQNNFGFDVAVKIADGLDMTLSELFLQCDELLHEEDPSWKLQTVPSKDGRHYAHISMPRKNAPR